MWIALARSYAGFSIAGYEMFAPLYPCRLLIDGYGQFIFKIRSKLILRANVESYQQRESILLDPTPCIVLATSGMMTGGPIVEYFKHWAPEPNNTLCFVGYQASGTLGSRLRDGHSSVPLVDKGQTLMVDVRCSMRKIDGFSGHSDRNQLMDYVSALNPTPRKIICHHGDAQTCNAFRQGLREKFRVQTYAPANLETLRLL